MSNLIYNVEDDASLRELIKYALTNAGYEVMSFETAEEMLTVLSERLPDLIILDIMLPQMDGIETLKIIRDKYKNIGIKIIMLTAKSSEVCKITGLDSGADDYITKPFSVLELTARVKAHLRKYTVAASDGALVCGPIALNPFTRSVSVDGLPLTLTYKEFELLYMFIRCPEVVLERDILLKEIWGYDYFGGGRTVDIHIKNLRAKLGIYGDCIVSVRGVGYSLKPA